MATIWVREFKGGLDVRRIPETAPGGTLIRGYDGHIDSGGQFRKRAKFDPTYTLPTNATKGLAFGPNGIYVFGHAEAPSMPSGVTYQRLQHPDGVTALSRILSFDLYAGKIYVAAEFADGSRQHYYDGARVTDWFDGRARVSFDVVGGVNAATSAVGSFEVLGGSNNPGVNEITDITIDGVSIISGSDIDHTGNNSTTAANIASAINSYSSSPDYTATSDGQTVTVTAVSTGPAVNGKTVSVSTAGDVLIGNNVNMAGGADSTTATLSDLKVDGVSIISAPVVWATSDTNFAALIAAAVNGFTSTPDYMASSSGTTVSIAASVAGPTANGRIVVPTPINNLTITPGGTLVLAGGDTATGTYQPGAFVKTIGSRMNSLSGANAHGSGIAEPTKWTTDAVGAFILDLTKQASGTDDMKAIAEYQGWVAYFAERVTIIYNIDSDPTQNRKVQVLRNTGTASPLSVTQFGDNDLFYLDESGVRSIRARDASNAAATTDMGSAIDDLITAKLRTLTANERDNVVGLINPIDKRFWLILKDEIYVFTFFEGSKISAWTIYRPFHYVNGVKASFNIDAAVVFQRRVYLRGGDSIFVYGGLATGLAQDKTSAIAKIPFLDGGSPTVQKKWTGFDAAMRGLWKVSVSWRVDETGVSVEEELGKYFNTTYSEPGKPALGESTHISLLFESEGEGERILSSCAMHYDGEEPDEA